MRLAIAVCILVGLAGVASARPRVTFTGNATFTAVELNAAMGDPFDANGKLVQELLEHGLLVLSSFYWDRGYARVKVGEPVISAAEIAIPITENERFTFGAITILARHRAALRVTTGALYSSTQLHEDRRRISRYYEELGHADVHIIVRTPRNIAARTVDVTFEITPGPVKYVEAVNLWCDRIHDAASVVQVFAHDRYDVRLFEGSRAALMRRGGLARDEVIISTKRGSKDSLVILNIECADP